MQSGQFAQLAGHLGKFAPFLGAFGSIVGIAGMFAPSAQGQQIQEIMKILNEGFNRMEHRFDRIEERLDDLERTIREEHFWTRLVSRLEDLSNVRSRVTGYLSVSDPAVKASRKADLDMSQYNSVYDAIIAIIDTFDGTNQPLDLCETVKEYSNIDRKVVLGVSIDLYNRMIRGVMDLVLIAKVLDRADVSKTQEEFAAKLERIGKAIGECDKEIESEAWLGTWQSDAMSVLGNTGKGKSQPILIHLLPSQIFQTFSSTKNKALHPMKRISFNYQCCHIIVVMFDSSSLYLTKYILLRYFHVHTNSIHKAGNFHYCASE